MSDQMPVSGLFAQGVENLFATHNQSSDNLRKKREEYALEIRSKDRESLFNLKRSSKSNTTYNFSSYILNNITMFVKKSMSNSID
jgi:hypothetical protein